MISHRKSLAPKVPAYVWLFSLSLKIQTISRQVVSSGFRYITDWLWSPFSVLDSRYPNMVISGTCLWLWPPPPPAVQTLHFFFYCCTEASPLLSSDTPTSELKREEWVNMYWRGVGASQAQLFLCRDNPAEAPICEIYVKFKSGKNICSWVYFHCTITNQSDRSDLSALFYQGLKCKMSKDSFILELYCLNASNVLGISWLNPHFKRSEPMSRSLSLQRFLVAGWLPQARYQTQHFLWISADYVTDKMCTIKPRTDHFQEVTVLM